MAKTPTVQCFAARMSEAAHRRQSIRRLELRAWTSLRAWSPCEPPGQMQEIGHDKNKTGVIDQGFRSVHFIRLLYYIFILQGLFRIHLPSALCSLTSFSTAMKYGASVRTEPFVQRVSQALQHSTEVA